MVASAHIANPGAEEVLRRLRILEGKGPKDLDLGICDNADLNKAAVHRFLVPLFVRWPAYSDCLTFPVKPYDAGRSPRDAYMHTKNLWDQETYYGRARWLLLNYLITELEKGL